jgi:hypothetical protein
MRGVNWNAWLWRLAVAVVIAVACAAFWLSARDDEGFATASDPSDARLAAHAQVSAAEPHARPTQKAPFVPPAPSAQPTQQAPFTPPTPSAPPTGAAPSDAPSSLATSTPNTPAATPKPDTAPATPTTLAPTSPGVRWLGRVDTRDSQNPRFSWQGAGVIATVHGSAIAVKLRTEGTDSVFFQPVVDGKPTPRIEVKSGADRDVTLATGLADSDHEVALYRETEGQFGVSTFLGFTRGTLQAAPRSNGRLIEVIGDSISAGQGILGSETHPNGVASPCDGGASNSSWFATYASLAGHALHAEVSTIARSGWGMYRDGTGDTQGVLSSLYDNTLGSSDTPKWTFDRQPAVVVINLGTNDWNVGDPGPAFESAARDFIQRIRSHYPSAWIFLAIGSKLWGSQFDEANARLRSVAAERAAAGDSKVISFDLGIQNLGADSMIPTGCAWHPSAAEHRRMASILRKQLATKLGW